LLLPIFRLLKICNQKLKVLSFLLQQTHPFGLYFTLVGSRVLAFDGFHREQIWTAADLISWVACICLLDPVSTQDSCVENDQGDHLQPLLSLKACDLPLDTQKMKLVQFPRSNRDAFPVWSTKKRSFLAR
jgi:hypothetical protein